MENKKSPGKQIMVVGMIAASVAPSLCDETRCDRILEPDLPAGGFSYDHDDISKYQSAVGLSSTLSASPSPSPAIPEEGEN